MFLHKHGAFKLILSSARESACRSVIKVQKIMSFLQKDEFVFWYNNNGLQRVLNVQRVPAVL